VQKIFITGGTGTIGQAFAEFLQSDFEITIFSRNENKQWEMKQRFPQFKYVIGDIRDRERTTEAMAGHDIVIHLAALKHVSFCSDNPVEAYKTNVTGTQNVIHACVENKVKRAIYMNTDKAINPISVYGKTKMIGYNLWDRVNTTHPMFFTIMSGNVWGSSGSVVQIYKSLVDHGEKYLPLTHIDSERYFTTTAELCELLNIAMNLEAPCVVSGDMFRIRMIDMITAFRCEPILGELSTGEKIREEFYQEGEYLTVDEIKEMIANV
jgi:FlaA1/EpsC-like NDP-sugar epimerase